ncbi:vestitone reductase-like [Papaver somniferum]|uniref:vestitone reductase-like n=1 Tax=Papaver somniferum TaxID=3469 RepID=UPI000E6F4786|nr:vestitone reductase-like [Papaver somniferum]
MEGGGNGTEKGMVCVTGGAGYIGSWLIMRLLERGYSVRATVRLDPERKRDISHLTNLPGASERLHIFNADLAKLTSFDEAIDGCVGVFHVAYPINIEENEADDATVKTLVDGSLDILKACLKSKTVKRVVYTSTAAAVVANKTGLMEVDENSWSDVEFCRNIKIQASSYIIPKTLIEQEVLKFGEENGLDVVSIIPPMVVGPFTCPHLPGSISLSLAMLLGNRYGLGFKATQMVHIDDIVAGHIFLFECPNAKGRYICSSHETSVHAFAKVLSASYPVFEMPAKLLSETKEEKAVHLSPKKLLSLGFNFRYDLKDMVDGAIQSCKEKGFL